MRIGMASGDWTARGNIGGCGHVRLFTPGNAVAAMGHEVAIGDGVAADERGWLTVTKAGQVLMSPAPEIMILQRWMRADAPGHVRRAVAAGQTVLVDVDDWFDGISTENSAWSATHPKTNPDDNRDHHRAVIGAATGVIASTPYLASRLTYAKHVWMVRNSIDVSRFEVIREINIERRAGRLRSQRAFRNTEPLVLQWVGATAYRSGDLAVLATWLPGWAADNKAIVRHVGDLPDARSFDDEVPVPVVDRIGMVPVADLPCVMGPADVGLAPLTHVPFNQAKCLDAETRISTKRGVLRIEDIVSGDAVWHEGAWKPVLATNHETATTGIELTTRSGLRLRLTSTHRLRSNGEWIYAGDLREGDVIDTVVEACPDLPYVTVPWPADGRLSRVGDVDPLAFADAPGVPRLTIDERWGRILGLYVGDGSMGGAKTGVVRWSCDGQDADLIASLMRDLADVGLPPGTEQQTRMFDGTLLRRRSVRVSSRHLVRALCAMGLGDIQTGKRTVRIPEAIWCSPQTVRRAFLAGLFEADGTCGRHCAMSLTSKHESLARDLQHLLLTVGITSTVRPRKIKAYPNNTYWIVSLRSAETRIFAEQINFLSTRKQQRLAGAVAAHNAPGQHGRGWGTKPDVVAVINECWLRPVDIQVEGEAFAARGIVSHNSAIKAMEGVAAGLPMLCSDLPEYKMLGPTLRRPAQWLRAINRMMMPGEAQELWSRQWVALGEHAVDKRAPQWLQALAQARAVTLLDVALPVA